MPKRAIKIAGTARLIAMVLVGVAFGGIVIVIQRAVRENCALAQQAHPTLGDDVAALVDYMNSESHSRRDRTHRGVWTLGQLGDHRAIPSLILVYDGECEHGRKLCQHEVQKAIKLCGGTPRAI